VSKNEKALSRESDTPALEIEEEDEEEDEEEEEEED